MCRYCNEYIALCLWVEACQTGKMPDNAYALFVDSMLSFYASTPDGANIAPDEIFNKTSRPWQQTAAILTMQLQGDVSLLCRLRQIDLPGWSQTFDAAPAPEQVRQWLNEWYLQQGAGLLERWQGACEQDDKTRLSALLVMVGLWHGREMSEQELHFCFAMAAYKPEPKEPTPSQQHWLRRQCRLLLWDKGYKGEVAQLDAKEEYLVSLRTLIYLRHDKEAEAQMQKWAPDHLQRLQWQWQQ